MKKLVPFLLTLLLATLGVCLAFFLAFAVVGINTAVTEEPLPALLSAGVALSCVSAAVWVWRRTCNRPAADASLLALARAAAASLASFGASFIFSNWLLFHEPTVQVIPLKSHYFLTIYQDWDVGGEELHYSLQGSRISARRSFFGFVMGAQKPVPHFTAHTSSDGRLAWVTADTQPNQVVFLLDFSNGLYWPSGVQGPSRWPNDASYLNRINADGERRSFYGGFYRLDAPNPRD